MEATLRQALNRDLPVLRKILAPWAEQDRDLIQNLENWLRNCAPETYHCTVLEIEMAVQAVSIWSMDAPRSVRFLAFGISIAGSEMGADRRLLQEEILKWAELGITRVTIHVPEPIASSIVHCLRSYGFLFEGLAAGYGDNETPRVRLSKRLLYRKIYHNQVTPFFQELMISLGYEVREEPDGFSYRVREEFRRPFVFSQWHRVTESGHDLILHPPAHVLEWHELETLFYPLRISAEDERPALLPMERRRADRLIDLFQEDLFQNSLFDKTGECKERLLRLNTVTYSHPLGKKAIRKGLPLLFYIHRMGAAGVARVREAYLEDASNLADELAEIGFFDEGDEKEHPGGAGPRPGKVQVIQFHWYRPFRRAVSLEEIRSMDLTFNPQRTRSVSSSLYESIVDAGNRAP